MAVLAFIAALIVLSPCEGFAGPSAGDDDNTLDMQALFRSVGAMYAIDSALLEAIAQVESGGRPYALSPAGAAGIMQLMPETALRFGVVNRYDAVESVLGSARFLNFLRYRSTTSASTKLTDLLAAYNAGPGAIARWRGTPPWVETHSYVRRVLRIFLESQPVAAPLGSSPSMPDASADSVDRSLLDQLQRLRRDRSVASGLCGTRASAPDP